MISSIFGKTKPINYIILLSFLFVFYWLVHLLLSEKAYDPESILFQTLVLSVLLFSVFWVNFIIKRNKITGTNSFAILFYTLLIIVFPEVMMDSNAVLCSFFLLLSFRRLLSIKSLKNIKYKIFDATLWITIASLFYDWALLYLILVFITIYFYEPKNIRNWLVPLVGMFTVFMIASSILILFDHLNFLRKHYIFDIEFNTDYYMYWGNSAKLIAYVLLISLVGFVAFLRLGKAGMGKIITMRLVAIFYLIGIVLTGLKTTSNVFPVIVTFFPAVAFLTNYVEVIKKPNLKEIALLTAILIPLVVFFSSLIIK